MLRRCLEEFVDKWANGYDELDVKIRQECLRHDIINLPKHYFGDHNNCQVTYIADNDCQEKTNVIQSKRYKQQATADETKKLELLKKYELFENVEYIFKQMSSRADSLLCNFSTNTVESTFNVFCMACRGKRVFEGSRSLALSKCNSAVVQVNTQQVMTEYYKTRGVRIPESVVHCEKKRQNKIAKNQKYILEHGRKKKHRGQGSDENYGTICQIPEMSEDEFAKKNQIWKK